jgi:NADH dehydrogenase FAD-containing subunit
VDRTNHHSFQPLLYQVAAGILPEGLRTYLGITPGRISDRR